MTTPHIIIHDCATGETITREMNDDELAQRETDQAQAKKDAAAKIKADQAIQEKRQIILDRLGITADELKTILP